MRTPTILVAEDDPIARNLIVQVLTGLGFRVFEADTATEALMVCRALQHQTLDLLIADHLLPQTNGRELAKEIAETCPNVKVLHLSTWPYSRMQAEDALLPGSGFLQKPFTGEQLTVVVQGLLASRTQ